MGKDLHLVKLSEKEVLDKYYKSKDFNLVNLYTQAIHQLVNIQLLYLDQIVDIANRNGICKQQLKQSLLSTRNHFNLFEVELRRRQGLKPKPDKQEEFNAEFDLLYEGLTEYFMKGKIKT